MANETLSTLLKQYEQKKSRAEIAADERKMDLYKKVPELQGIEDKINSVSISVTKHILASPESNAGDTLKNFNHTIDTLKAQKAQIFKKFDIPADYLEPHYECPICKDTGFIKRADYTSEMCNCLKQKLLNISFNKSNMSALSKENFNNFNANFFSDQADPAKYRFNISPRENIMNIKNRCLEFIENFDDPSAKNLLFTGNTGLR